MLKSEAQAAHPYRQIFETYVDDASFLWLLRDNALIQPHYTVDDLVQLEKRIDAHLEGLISAPALAWELCEEALTFEQAGEVFTAAITAFTSSDIHKIQKAVEVGLSNNNAQKGLISALAWLPGKVVHPWVKKFFMSKELEHKCLAVATCSARREDPSTYLNKLLERDDCLENEALHSRCLRIIGELKRDDLLNALIKSEGSELESVKFWALWSLVMLGQKDRAETLEPFILSSESFSQKAIDLYFRVIPITKARQLITRMGENKERVRDVIYATAVLGDPQAVDWLLRLMNEQKLARVAGEAFTTITGIQLEPNQLHIDVADSPTVIPKDEPEDENLELDPDEHLPWPDAHKVASVWASRKATFTAGHRYFLGRAIEEDVLKHQLRHGFQRRRRMAAVELALMQAQQVLFNVDAKGGGFRHE